MHPLRAYLNQKHEHPYQFAARAGIARQQVYDLCNGDPIAIRIDTMIKIERATGGEVSAGAMMAWHEQRQNSQSETGDNFHVGTDGP